MNEKIEKIRIEYSTDGISADLELTQAQLADYAESLRDELREGYPGVDIEVTESSADTVVVYSDDYNVVHSVGSNVQQAISEHWPRWIDRIVAEM